MADPDRLDELKRKFDENPKRYFAPLANEYRKAGQPELAIELCRTYLPQQPTHMSGYIVYGQALHDAGHTDESAAVFKQALTLDPENIIALRHLGDISRDAGDNVGAMRWYGKVLELDPRNEEIAAYITSLAQPGSQQPGSRQAPRQPERQAPPTVRPEPEPDDSAVSLEDIVSEPDEEQVPIAPEQIVFSHTQEMRMIESDEPFEITDWPSAAASEESNSAEENSVLEGPWHTPSADADSPSPEHAPEPAAAADESPAQGAAPRGSSPFVTETMAELYMRQGLHGEALAIYRELVIRRDDPALHQKISDIEAQQANASKSEGTREAAREATPEAPQETVRQFFARIGAKRPNERVEMAAERRSSLGTLLGSANLNADDISAAQRLSGAFGNPPSGASRS